MVASSFCHDRKSAFKIWDVEDWKFAQHNIALTCLGWENSKHDKDSPETEFGRQEPYLDGGAQ